MHALEQSSLSMDGPEDAELKKMDLQSGDILMMASDGVWDNLHTSEILPKLSKIKSDPSTHLGDICHKITSKARKHSEDRKFVSPFTLKAIQHGRFIGGGKIDDITLVLIRVF